MPSQPSPFQSREHGVGNSRDEDPIAAVRGAEGGSRKAVPFSVVPARGQPSEYFAKQSSGLASNRSESKEVCDVLHDDVVGSKLANDSEHLSPKRSLGMPESVTPARATDALAGEPACDEINSSCPGVGADGDDVGVDGDAGESFVEELASEGVAFAEPEVPVSGEVESEVEEAGAGEETADIHAAS